MALFTGPQIREYNIRVLRIALRAHVNHKIRMHRNLTPTRMLMLASNATGKTYKGRAYAEALRDLDQLLGD